MSMPSEPDGYVQILPDVGRRWLEKRPVPSKIVSRFETVQRSPYSRLCLFGKIYPVGQVVGEGSILISLFKQRSDTSLVLIVTKLYILTDVNFPVGIGARPSTDRVQWNVVFEISTSST